MKRLLFIVATVLAISTVFCFVGAIVLDSTDTWYNPYAPYLFACGVCCSVLCALVVVARSWFYDGSLGQSVEQVEEEEEVEVESYL